MKKHKAVTLTIPALGRGAGSAALPGAGLRGRTHAFDRNITRQLLAALGHPPLAIILWNGEEIASAQRSSKVRVRIGDRGALYKLIRHPNLHFGDLYSVGRIEIEGDLVTFLETAYTATSTDTSRGLLKRLAASILNRPRVNTLTGSRRNIHHHYDIGNEFYRLWLDNAAMQYTCAYFPSPTMTLERAQIAKMDHVCRKLQLKPGERVAEAGCGWGGLALHMARHYGVTVRAFNISHEQVGYARERARVEGLSDRVEYIEDDYRNISGEYDAFVSVGMLEHVGRDHYPGLGEVIHRSLSADGRGLIHSIGRNKPEPMNAWIEKRIFPGAYPPSLREMMEIFEPRAFSVLDVENLRLHYAKTLEHWLERFNRHEREIEEMFDRFFVRAWRLYLAGSIAAFNSGTLQLFQAVFARAQNNRLPWSRAHLYQTD